MPGPDDPDYTVRVTGGDQPARYRLTFGSLLRGGAVYDTPTLDRTIDGRVTGGVATIAPGETHEWRADGPISLLNNGRGTIGASINGSDPVPIGVSGAVDTSCPTERRRVTALGVVGGALLGAATGVLD